MKKTIQVAFISIGIFSLFLLLLSGYMQKDSTDPPEGRSGMGLRTDHKTGCQYLTNPRGGITPRMNADGQHICRSN